VVGDEALSFLSGMMLSLFNSMKKIPTAADALPFYGNSGVTVFYENQEDNQDHSLLSLVHFWKPIILNNTDGPGVINFIVLSITKEESLSTRG
jgi:hypothetical protein